MVEAGAVQRNIGAFIMILAVAAVTGGAAPVTPANEAGPVDLHVDCSKEIGLIRPLHGGNCGPVDEGGLVDLTEHFRELGIPHTRLHDCHWPFPNVVDIHAIFPDFDADPASPESYDFARTDDYIQSVVATGSKIVYRLGESIEHTKKKYYVHPPADYDKWAAVCLGVIRHYNEGWADGFRHDIQYWEIWNEPENRPAMWTGTDEEYLRLYETAARAIKAQFPDLKVGGPSLGYTGEVKDGRFEPSAFLVRFLEHCRGRKLPLDFFSWHLYTDDPAECLVRSKGIRDVLDRLGFAETELHFNEWNYLPGNDWSPLALQNQGPARDRFYEQMAGPAAGAFAAAVLMNLQDSPVDVANFFRADNGGGFGLFTPHGTPTKAFFAFKAFRMLLDTPARIETRGGEAGSLVLCAGTNEQKTEVRILVSNYRSDAGRVRVNVAGLPWEGPTRCEAFIVDGARDLEPAGESQFPAGTATVEQELPAPGVCLIKLTKADL